MEGLGELAVARDARPDELVDLPLPGGELGPGALKAAQREVELAGQGLDPGQVVPLGGGDHSGQQGAQPVVIFRKGEEDAVGQGHVQGFLKGGLSLGVFPKRFQGLGEVELGVELGEQIGEDGGQGRHVLAGPQQLAVFPPPQQAAAIDDVGEGLGHHHQTPVGDPPLSIVLTQL